MVDTSPRLGVPSEPVRAARQHCAALFGPAALTLRGVPDVVAYSGPPKPSVFATAGASSLIGRDGVVREWLLCAKHPHSLDVAAALMPLVARVAAEGTPTGRVVRAYDELSPLAPFCVMRAVVLLPAWPLPERERTFRRRDGVHVTLGWIVPVHPDEADLARRESATALWRRFATTSVDLLDLARPPIQLA
jgi:hypothetical protein